MLLPVVGKAHEATAGPGPFHWFIYGSSLDRSAFTDWAGQHGYRVPDFARAVPARLDGYRLAFDVASRFWGGTVASLVEAPGRSVEGLALPLPGEARGLVDHKEGAIWASTRRSRWRSRPSAAGARFRALAYRSAPGRRLPSEQPPSPGFVEVLIQGARASGLSPGWVAELEALRRR